MTDYATNEKRLFLAQRMTLKRLIAMAAIKFLRFEISVCDGKVDRIDVDIQRCQLERAQVLADRAALEDRVKRLMGAL